MRIGRVPTRRLSRCPEPQRRGINARRERPRGLLFVRLSRACLRRRLRAPIDQACGKIPPPGFPLWPRCQAAAGVTAALRGALPLRWARACDRAASREGSPEGGDRQILVCENRGGPGLNSYLRQIIKEKRSPKYCTGDAYTTCCLSDSQTSSILDLIWRPRRQGGRHLPTSCGILFVSLLFVLTTWAHTL